MLLEDCLKPVDGLTRQKIIQDQQPTSKSFIMTFDEDSCGFMPRCDRNFQKSRQQLLPVLFLLNLNIGLVLSLLVLQGTVQKEDAGVVDFAAHAPWGHNILLKHDTIQHPASKKLS